MSAGIFKVEFGEEDELRDGELGRWEVRAGSTRGEETLRLRGTGNSPGKGRGTPQGPWTRAKLQ